MNDLDSLTMPQFATEERKNLGVASSARLLSSPSISITNHQMTITSSFSTKKWKVLNLVTFLASIACVILAAYTKVSGDNAVLPQGIVEPYHRMLPVSSCKDVQKSENGIYLIQPTAEGIPFFTYCDMESDRGGWTLVAAVHENDIYAKCCVGDRWSSQHGQKFEGVEKSLTSPTSWENFETFGNIEAVTSDDYKNPAYFSAQAKNLMVWHVPSHTSVANISSSARFKYFTQDDFLERFGGNLQSFFHHHYPIRETEGGLEQYLESVEKVARYAVEEIDDFHFYTYDLVDGSTIVDGGDDMYDEGNQVFFGLNGEEFVGPLTYDKSYFFFENEIELNIRSGQYPFQVIGWVGNARLDNISVSIRLKSDFGADGRGAVSVEDTKNLTVGSVEGKYFVYNLVNASDPSVCEVYFFLTSESWNSVEPAVFDLNVKFKTSTRTADNTMTVSGKLSNVIIGYTLLSKNNGEQVTQLEIESVLKQLMEQAENLNYQFPGVSHSSKVEFLRGSKEEILQSIPLDEIKRSEGGYIQFRVYNQYGVPFALCPGLRTTSTSPERLCIGTSIDSYSSDKDSCSDFTNWDGTETPLPESPTNTSRSLKDITSVILIFTR